MPAAGDQHKPNGSTTSNPFEDQPLRITEYTAQEIATLQSRLDKQLGPEYIASRAGPGGSKLHYLPADKAISLANQVFGFNGWSSSIQNIQIDFVDENPQTGKISLGLSVIVRVTLKDGTHHEDIGYGQIENCKSKANAFEKAKKEGTTDGLKRALRSFGNVLGNCVYDKAYVAKVTKLKVANTKWDENMLHRHADFAPKKEQEEMKPAPAAHPAQQDDLAEFEDSFELADFDELEFDEGELDHPDGVSLPPETTNPTRTAIDSGPGRPNQPSRTDLVTPSKPQFAAGPQLGNMARNPVQVSGPGNAYPQPLPGQQRQNASAAVARPTAAGRLPADSMPRISSPDSSSHHFPPPQPGQVMGFYSAKAAEKLDGNNNIVGGAPGVVLKFNPHAESPSIRKTPGVVHNSSVPLKRDLTVDTTPIRRDLMDPEEEPLRRVGVPGPAPLPGQLPGMRRPGTSAYRPPTRRGATDSNVAHFSNSAENGGVDRVLHAARRTPLGDMSNMQHNVTAVASDGADAKRQRVSDVGQNDRDKAGIPGDQKSNA